MHIRRGGIGVPEANSGRACEFLKDYLFSRDGKSTFAGEHIKFKLAESINTVCNHVDNVREITYGRNADWRDYNDSVIEDNITLKKEILRNRNAGSSYDNTCLCGQSDSGPYCEKCA